MRSPPSHWGRRWAPRNAEASLRAVPSVALRGIARIRTQPPSASVLASAAFSSSCWKLWQQLEQRDEAERVKLARFLNELEAIAAESDAAAEGAVAARAASYAVRDAAIMAPTSLDNPDNRCHRSRRQ